MTARPTRRELLLAAAAAAGAVPLSAAAATAQAAGSDDVKTLNGLLAVEHAVIFDLAAAGGTLAITARTRVLRDYDAHRARRDVLTARIRSLGGQPVAALPAYADPAPQADGVDEVATIEQAAVLAYHDALKVLVDPALRGIAANAFLTECRHVALARAAAGLAGAPQPFVTGAG